MEKLIPVINKLQDVFNTVGREAIQLPQIAVIGTQSTGKSSVLEGIVGRDFLPRGSGIVTRRPLVLQLVHVSETEAKGSWGWAKFLHIDDEQFEDFGAVRKEIERVTEEVAGSNKGISSEPIRLRIFSPHVLNLTLIDLPGITRVPVGDQPHDIEERIREMVLLYITNPNSIILAVHAANTDLATSESLKLAREVDPNGDRTVAVCTKLDLMDSGTDARDLLTGKVIPVKLGIVGVVNRSQQDILDSKSIEDALKDEQAFLRRWYPDLAARNGTSFLTKTLNKLLMQHIRDCLPILRHDISNKLTMYESQLIALGDPIEKKGPALLQALTRFSTSYCQKIDGTSRDIETHQLSGGARICYIFHHTFTEALRAIEPLEDLSRSDILHAISNAMGPRPALFVSEIAFELLVKKQIRLLLPPSLQCVELVYEELQRIIQYALSHIRDFQRFPVLRDRVNHVVMDLLRQRQPITNVMVENLISIELAYINTNHPDFVGGTRAAYESYMMMTQSNPFAMLRNEAITSQSGHDDEKTEQPKESISNKPGGGGVWRFWSGRSATEDTVTGSKSAPSKQDSGLNVLSRPLESSADPYPEHPKWSANPNDIHSRQSFDCELIEKLITSYFLIVRKSIQDSVPKAVMHCLVNFVRDKLQSELVSELYKREAYDELMEESVDTIARRHEIEEMVSALQKAHEILNEVRDLQYELDIVGTL